MSHRVFHKEYLQDPCGNPVEFFGSRSFRSFSTGFSFRFCTGFVVEKASHPGFFLGFNNTTNTTNDYY